MPVLEFSWNFFPGIFLVSWNFPGILAFWQKFYCLLNNTLINYKIKLKKEKNYKKIQSIIGK